MPFMCKAKTMNRLVLCRKKLINRSLSNLVSFLFLFYYYYYCHTLKFRSDWLQDENTAALFIYSNSLKTNMWQTHSCKHKIVGPRRAEALSQTDATGNKQFIIPHISAFCHWPSFLSCSIQWQNFCRLFLFQTGTWDREAEWVNTETSIMQQGSGRAICLTLSFHLAVLNKDILT